MSKLCVIDIGNVLKNEFTNHFRKGRNVHARISSSGDPTSCLQTFLYMQCKYKDSRKGDSYYRPWHMLTSFKLSLDCLSIGKPVF